MTLDEQLRSGKLSRREMLERLAAGSGLLAINNACGGKSSSSPTPVPTSTPTPTPTPGQTVNQIVEVYNSDGTHLGTAVYNNVQVGSSFTIAKSNLKDASGNLISTGTIDDNFLATYEKASGSLGAFNANTTNGQLQARAINGVLSLYGMNNQNGADYAGAYASGLGKKLLARNATVRKLKVGEASALSGTTIVETPSGHENAILTAIAKLDELLVANGTRYGSISWVGEAASANIAGGYVQSPLMVNGQRANAFHNGSGKFILANELIYTTAIISASEEIMEEYFIFDDLKGADTKLSIYATESDRKAVQISPIGADYIRFGALIQKP